MARLSAGTLRRPRSGKTSAAAHLGLTLLLPALLYVLVRIDFVQMAILLVILSKWRMFAVRMRYWPANIRSNAVDIMVGISTVIFIASTGSSIWQIGWAVLYALWLILLKPRSGTLYISLQAAIAQLVGMMVLFISWGDAPVYVLVFMSWLICYFCARHFFTSFDEAYASLYAHFWGYFAGALVWVLSHWLLFYGRISQPTLLLLVIGYGLGTLYYLDHESRLSSGWRRQFVTMMTVIVVIILALSDWGDQAL